MAPREALVEEPRANRWLRRMAPVLILLGWLLVVLTPGILIGSKRHRNKSSESTKKQRLQAE